MQDESCTWLPSVLPHPSDSRWGRLQRVHELGVRFVQLCVLVSGYFPV